MIAKVIRFSRYKFDKNHIQHNVTFSVSALLGDFGEVAKERVHIMNALLETLCPNTMTVVSFKQSARCPTDAERALSSLNFSKRTGVLNPGDQIRLEQLEDIMFYCYSNGYELELDILDIKDQHVTAVVNRDLLGYHYIYGTPETLTKEYLNAIKKKLKDCVFDGSFTKTL